MLENSVLWRRDYRPDELDPEYIKPEVFRKKIFSKHLTSYCLGRNR